MSQLATPRLIQLTGPLDLARDGVNLTWTGANIVFGALNLSPALPDVVRAIHNFGDAGTVVVRYKDTQRTQTFYLHQGADTPPGRYDAIIAAGTTAQSLSVIV